MQPILQMASILAIAMISIFIEYLAIPILAITADSEYILQ